MEEKLQVGVLSSTHGVHGEMKVYPTTDDVTRFKKLKKVYVDLGNEEKELEITNVKFWKNMVILKFKGYDSINDIEKYKDYGIFVNREDAVPLDKDEYFIADMIGMDAYDEAGNKVGILEDVLSTGANDVYVIKTVSNEEILLPAIKECILDVDIDKRILKIRLQKEFDLF